MDFEPINADHAIQLVAFTIALDRVFSTTEVSEFRRSHKLWRADLPAVGPSQALVVAVNPQSGVQETTNALGVEFSHLRADGSPAWVLRMVGQEINVECHRYTRWDRVWERARQHIYQALDLVVSASPIIQITNVSLSVLDKFKAPSEEYELSALFEPSEMLPAQVFSVGPTWHSHTGWFRQEGDDSILNQLNVDARWEQFLDADSGEPKQGLFVCILHAQQQRFRRFGSLGDQLDHTKHALDIAVGGMHHKNKELMRNMLTQSMKERIGLNA